RGGGRCQGLTLLYFTEKKTMRSSGVLMHISSLPSPYGIGTMGEAARSFIDFLEAGGQHCWQLLPIAPTGFGDSPYQSFSSYGGNPYFIDLDTLAEEGLLEREEFCHLSWGENPEKVDYGLLYQNRFQVLRKATARLLAHENSDFSAFCADNASWLSDYALFMALKDANGGKSWFNWDAPLKLREPAALENAGLQYKADIDFYKALQFLFYRQWNALHSYATGKGISIIGDLPIYVAPDSAELWSEPKMFQLDENLLPTEVAGCPPDGFTAEGQLWGNPLYAWEALAQEGYAWWISRISHQLKIFDVLRIDHFRGFDSYYSIPFGSENAKNGLWRRGPGMELFRALKNAIGEKPIIAEDLGFLTPSVRALLADSGFPGMKVLQFAFDSREDSDYLPHNFPVNCVAYTGTHDNDTINGWMNSAPAADIAKAREYLRISEDENSASAMLCALWGSVAETAIAQMQDLLGLSADARMNTPGTMSGNWQWRMKNGAATNELALWLRRKTELYGRL
ncbi:MAG: 4-alpha-glucanotransferase, partial [Oscillospiraceae bacterium]